MVRATLETDASDARWLATAYSAAWPWSVALFIPLALLSFPDGRLPGLGMAVPVVVANSVVQVLPFSSDPFPLPTVPELDPPPTLRRSSPCRVAHRRRWTSYPRSC